MIFIFGWGHQKITAYGHAEEQECSHCHNKAKWELKKIQNYFTLFFIPIFPYQSNYFYHCPICNQGLKIDREHFEIYRNIAEVNADYHAGTISGDEKDKRLTQIYSDLETRRLAEQAKNEAGSKKFDEVVREKSDEELKRILSSNHAQYSPEFIVSVQAEVERRGLRG